MFQSAFNMETTEHFCFYLSHMCFQKMHERGKHLQQKDWRSILPGPLFTSTKLAGALYREHIHINKTDISILQEPHVHQQDWKQYSMGITFTQTKLATAFTDTILTSTRQAAAFSRDNIYKRTDSFVLHGSYSQQQTGSSILQ